MKRKIYLVNAAADFPSYFNSEPISQAMNRPVATVAALALPTVAAMIPDDFEVEICDENTTPVDLDHPAEFIGLTGMVNQWGRTRELAQEFRRRGKIVLMGGPQATLRPEVVRPHCDILVLGEIEAVAEELFTDLLDGSWRDEYRGGKPDLSTSPLPRMELCDNEHTLAGAVQTSRGCPFNCEFCDVIQYNGRKQRYKPIDRVIAELQQLYELGYRHVFITDDNLTVNRRRAKDLLAAIASWNQANPEPVVFSTQVSIDCAADEELLELCRAANLTEVFVGIESVNPDSLKEVGKNQNLQVDMQERMAAFARFGISVLGGMIVGFDADDLDIFRQQFAFAMSLPIPVFTTAALFAPETTPLYRRLAAEGRVDGGSSDHSILPWDTNVHPRQMNREELREGLIWLLNNLYNPENFARRLLKLADQLDSSPRKKAAPNPRKMRKLEKKCLGLLLRIPLMGPGEARMVARLILKVLRKPQVFPAMINYLLYYQQIRHMFDRAGIWQGGRAEYPLSGKKDTEERAKENTLVMAG
jgi:hypothetical protein